MSKFYTHKLTGQILTIKKDYGSVVSCYCEPYLLWNNVKNDTVICLKENLIERKEYIQQKLFL